jgi:hypothetical protein
MPHVRQLMVAAGVKNASDMPDPVKSTQTAWDQDEFSYGAYSGNGFGIKDDARAKMARPVAKRVLFAGEATNGLFWGCVHGAYVSGLREAVRITGDTSLIPEHLQPQERRQLKKQFNQSRFVRFLVATAEKAPEKLNVIFDAIDEDKSGKIDEEELRAAFAAFREKVTIQETKSFIELLDTNKDGEISKEEIIENIKKLKSGGKKE